MGLDMYINAKKYLSTFDKEENEISEQIKAMLGEVPGESQPNSFVGRVQQVEVQAAYWRKANHIHAWFVKHCQDGRDECQETYIGREVLERLIGVCKTVLEAKTPAQQRKKAQELLPPQAGFFFGSTEIDEWYFQDIKDTVRQLEPLLDEKWHKEWSFYYRASW